MSRRVKPLTAAEKRKWAEMKREGYRAGRWAIDHFGRAVLWAWTGPNGEIDYDREFTSRQAAIRDAIRRSK